LQAAAAEQLMVIQMSAAELVALVVIFHLSLENLQAEEHLPLVL
jgi:hypothetical protein